MGDLALILALGENDALGLAGGLPWAWPEDRAHFERTVRGHPVIMGRRTFEEKGEPLVGSTNVVVSTTLPARAGIVITPTLDDAIRIARLDGAMPFVIGGARLFAETLPRATRVYLTTIPRSPEADVYFRLDRTGLDVEKTWTDDGGARYEILARRPVRHDSWRT